MRAWGLLSGFGLAVAGVLASGVAAQAQSVPEQYVVTGKAADKIQEHNTINMATAERIAESCEKAATAQGVQISVIVLDNAGNHVYFDRMDGQGYLNIITAEMKARTALALRGPSKTLMNRVDPGSHVGTAVHSTGRICEFGRVADRGEQPNDRLRRRGRVGAASAGVER